MKLYDETIKELLESLQEKQPKKLDVSGSNWPDVGDRNLILRSDMAYELGGGNLPGVSAMAVTCDENLVQSDSVYLLGPDLQDIKADTAYAKLVLVRLKEDSIGEGNALYQSVRKIEYVRYHVSPEGFMPRISASSKREAVRVGKEALGKGLDFAKAGQLYLDKYHENPAVEAVMICFITDQGADFEKLAGYADKFEGITSAIDHIMKDVVMNCGACSLKEVCDEVEELRQLHVKAREENN